MILDLSNFSTAFIMDNSHILHVKRFLDFNHAAFELRNFSQCAQSPFQELSYQEVFSNHFSNQDNVYLLGIYQENLLIAWGGFERWGETVLFLGMKPVLGEEEVTDYGDIVVDTQIFKGNYVRIWEAIFTYFRSLGVKKLQLDYVREDSSTYQTLSNKTTHIKVATSKQEVSPYVLLPNTWEDHLNSLSRKRRKELRRKLRRLEETQYSYTILEIIQSNDLEDFFKLHRLSDSQKHKFMSKAMAAFFEDVVFAEKKYWRIKLGFLEMNSQRVASVLFFEDDKQVLLYNSGFDPKFGYYSVGLLCKAFQLKTSIEKKKLLYDFMRGNERYKYDLGACNLQLFRLTIAL